MTASDDRNTPNWREFTASLRWGEEMVRIAEGAETATL